MKFNLKMNELIGLFMLFLSGILIGMGLYVTFWGANRPLLFGSMEYLLRGKEFIIFPLFYGLGFVLWALGHIELKEAMPRRRK